MKNEPVLEGDIVLQKELTALVGAAKNDKHALNTLLHDYMPFIKKCVASVFLKGQSKEDNLTDAMLAFAQSVQTYNPEQGAFIQYAAAVIRNRLIDSVRKELSAQKRFISLNIGTDEKEMAWENAVSLQAYDREEEERNMRLEIETVNGKFAQWGFSWETLLRKCPKQERSRRAALRIAKTVLRDRALLDHTLKTRQLPLSRLAMVFPMKALEKYRQYIAALIIISQGDYPYLYSFVPHHLDEEETT